MNKLLRRCVASLVAAFLILPHLYAFSDAASFRLVVPKTARAPIVAAAAGQIPPQRIPIPEPPRRTPMPLVFPTRGALHAAAMSVRPPRGGPVAGPPMLRPSEIDGILSAARARSRQMSTHRAEAVKQPPAPPPVIAPGHVRGAAAPSSGAVRRTRTLQAPAGTGINPWWRYEEENVPGGGHVMVNVGTGNML
ncbi:MAG TPA: hypothetical protein VGU66_02450, partial [Candidatus Elarobacter sp.]|nr:hypothetical protein [Candidatus Elarobacter sp.]